MSKRKERSYLTYLHDILESIEAIKEYTEYLTENDFLNNQEKQDAVIRRIEIIGEAANRIPKSMKNKYKDIPWRDMTGLRNIVIHEYFGVHLSMVWRVATVEINPLPDRIKRIISDLPE